MQRHSKTHRKSDALRMLNALATERQADTWSDANRSELREELSKAIDETEQDPILIHGLQTEKMFASVAASLGACQIVKEEDSGELLSLDPKLAVADYRIVTLKGEEFFVEVKNHWDKNPRAPFTMKEEYRDKLLAYGDLFKKPVYLAVFWARWSFWTLVTLDKLQLKGKKLLLELPVAMMANEMKLIGDTMIGTTPPLTLEVFMVPEKPKRLNRDGTQAKFIRKLNLYSGGVLITRELERRIAWFLLMYGDWPFKNEAKPISRGKRPSMVHEAVPIEYENPDEDFELVGLMSSMISKQFRELTRNPASETPAIVRLTPRVPPGSFGVPIPTDYKGEVLRLWRITLSPGSLKRELAKDAAPETN